MYVSCVWNSQLLQFQGGEFESREMRIYFKEKGVQKYASRSDDVKVSRRFLWRGCLEHFFRPASLRE